MKRNMRKKLENKVTICNMIISKAVDMTPGY